MPDCEDPDRLLALQVCPYVRHPIRPPIRPGLPIYATYRSASASVLVELGICSSPTGAKIGLSNATAEMDAEFPDVPKLFAIKGDPAYFKAPTRGFLAWTRDRYYFSASASNSEEEMDRFMQVFPY